MIHQTSFGEKTREEIAKENHDLFNLVALLFVVGATLLNWDLRYIHLGPEAAWTGTYFYTNWLTTVAYFLVDLVWVASIPLSVKSPGTIIKHHFVAIAYLSGPVLWPQYRWFMGACLSVEINTWFLILRRVLYKRKSSELSQKIVSAGFYASWIAIRVILYPLIMFIFCFIARRKVVDTGILWHWPMMFIPVHAFLCFLNLKWTYDLFSPMFQREEKTMSSGL